MFFRGKKSGRPMKVAMLLSGGVDSSVALRLLKEQGHDVTAFYLKIWLEDELQYLGECPWEEDLEYAREVCEAAGVPLKVVPMQKEYWERVVQYTVDEARAGRTPNPDIFCNQRIKFGRFYEVIPPEFEKVATGHYARVEERRISGAGRGGTRQGESCFVLKIAPDRVKDQTYFLAYLSQQQLSRALFPIGHLTKKKVRALAKKFDLPNQNRKDSQGICFLGKIPFKEFLRHHLDEKPGDFVDAESGKVVGRHAGYWFYTIGQRQGLGLNGGPWFVVKKDMEKNLVYVANGYAPEAVYQKEFMVGGLHSICPQMPLEDGKYQVKIRHGAASHACELKVEDGSGAGDSGLGRVVLKKPLHGVAPGQFAVFYKGDICVGCAVIA